MLLANPNRPLRLLVALVASLPATGAVTTAQEAVTEGTIVELSADWDEEFPSLVEQAEAPARPFDGDAWRTRLADPDLAAREASFDAVVAAARTHPEARAFLAGLVEEGADELAWTARLALREVDCAVTNAFVSTNVDADDGRGRLFTLRLHAADPAVHGAVHGAVHWDGLAIGGLDVELSAPAPPAPPAAADPLVGWWSALAPDVAAEDLTVLAELGGELEDVRQDLFVVFEEAGRTFEGQLADQLGALALPGVPATVPGAEGETRSVKIESDGTKVRIEVLRRDADGAGTETYEGRTIEDLLERHEELRALLPRARGEARGLVSREVRTDVLGVLVKDTIEPSVCAKLGLGAGCGVRVSEIFPGTIAEQLNVSQGSVLVELNGVTLRTGDDITTALSTRGPRHEVTLTWFDPTGERLRRTWAPPAPRRLLRVVPPADER